MRTRLMKERLLDILTHGPQDARYSEDERRELRNFIRSHRFIPLVKKLRVEIGSDETLPK